MDAATSTKTLILAFFAGLSMNCIGYAEDDPSPPTGFAAVFGDWLSKTPKFSAELAIHFGNPGETFSKLKFGSQSDEKNSEGGVCSSDLGILGQFIADAKSRTEFGGESPASPPLRIAKPMTFSIQIKQNPLGKDEHLIQASSDASPEVISCDHRICSGDKCCEVKDGLVAGIQFETEVLRLKSTDCGSEEVQIEDEDPIVEVPIAPPAPPTVQVASDRGLSDNLLPSIAANKVTVPLSTLVELMVSRTELSTRLEMTEQLMLERQAAIEKIQEISERNAKLAAQLAVAEARQQYSDVLTASVVERAELAMKFASLDSNQPESTESNRSVQAIHEDLSNIRRQIALIRRSQPVAFAPSFLGTRVPTPYVPTAQLHSNHSTEENRSDCSHPDCAGSECARGY
jgi:hypothetical protein